MLSAFGWKQFSLIGFGINGETIGFCWGRRGFIIERAGVERGFFRAGGGANLWLKI